jgi:copper(I)-binding protein
MKRFAGLILGLALMIGVEACSSAKDKKASGGIVVEDAWVRATTAQMETPAQMDSGGSGGMGDMNGMDNTGSADNTTSSGDVSGAFMVIENTSDQVERLVKASVSADVAETVEIHETTIDENSVMRMRPVDGIDVPANGRVELKPGGYHIMLLNVQKALTPGDKLPLTLTFASGQTVTIEAQVRAVEG